MERFVVMELTTYRLGVAAENRVEIYGAEGAEDGLGRRWNLPSQSIRMISWVIAPAISAVTNAKPVAGIKSIHARATSIMP